MWERVGHIPRVTNCISRAPVNQTLEMSCVRGLNHSANSNMCAMKCKESVLAFTGKCNIKHLP